jgi:hypothetical protein
MALKVEIAYVPDDDNQVANMTAAAKSGKLVATPPTNASRAAGWVPSTNCVSVPGHLGPEYVESKLAEYGRYDEAGQGQLDTIRLNGMEHAGLEPDVAPPVQGPASAARKH